MLDKTAVIFRRLWSNVSNSWLMRSLYGNRQQQAMAMRYVVSMVSEVQVDPAIVFRQGRLNSGTFVSRTDGFWQTTRLDLSAVPDTAAPQNPPSVSRGTVTLAIFPQDSGDTAPSSPPPASETPQCCEAANQTPRPSDDCVARRADAEKTRSDGAVSEVITMQELLQRALDEKACGSRGTMMPPRKARSFSRVINSATSINKRRKYQKANVMILRGRNVRKIQPCAASWTRKTRSGKVYGVVSVQTRQRN